MAWIFTSDRPIYLQVQEKIKLSIVSGEYPPGWKMPAVRDLALEAAVNPNTVQKALSELEREGFVYTQRTSGRYITEDDMVIKQAKNELATELVRSFLGKMAAIGFSPAEAALLIGDKAKEVDGNGDTGM
ncbi:MAG: GntR family transcriptional regulator [Clostridiales bacterium]|nr:GntR family transcriptional regulator [Clostridiales bacterium]